MLSNKYNGNLTRVYKQFHMGLHEMKIFHHASQQGKQCIQAAKDKLYEMLLLPQK